jgi:hypothetical protein
MAQRIAAVYDLDDATAHWLFEEAAMTAPERTRG